MYARGDASDLLMDREDNQEHLALLVPRRKQSETHWDPRRRIGDRGAVLADWLCGRTAAFGTHADSYKVHLDGQYKKNTLRRSYVDRQNVVIGTYPTKYAARTCVALLEKHRGDVARVVNDLIDAQGDPNDAYPHEWRAASRRGGRRR